MIEIEKQERHQGMEINKIKVKKNVVQKSSNMFLFLSFMPNLS